MNPLYLATAERARHRCEYCLAPEEVFNFAFQVDHIRPQAHGGMDDTDNLALACQSCNAFKSDFVTGYDAETRTDVPLFHPRLGAAFSSCGCGWRNHRFVAYGTRNGGASTVKPGQPGCRPPPLDRLEHISLIKTTPILLIKTA